MEYFMELLSPAFEEGQRIPALFTRDGDNISPPLQWRGVPDSAKTLALIMEDPDAPNGLFTHWIIYNLPATLPGLDHEVPAGGHYGGGALQGINDYGGVGYGGPQPPGHEEHRYILRLLALDERLPLGPEADREELLGIMSGHIIDEAQLTGRYAHGDEAELEDELERSRSREGYYDRAVHYAQSYKDMTGGENSDRFKD
jgi:Raf kinase inhibitor-like YbhB/YbcL family protein